MSDSSHIDSFVAANERWLLRPQICALAILNVMSHEIHPSGQAFVDHPKDPGGATHFGISLRFLAAQGSIDADGDGWLDGDYDRDGDVDADDIRGLTYQQAADLYVAHFWTPYGIDQLPARLAIKVFDMAVNMGPRPAVKILQRTLMAFKPYKAKPLIIDGAIGPATLQAADAWLTRSQKQPFIDTLRLNLEIFYEKLARSNPDFESFLRGWRKRAHS